MRGIIVAGLILLLTSISFLFSQTETQTQVKEYVNVELVNFYLTATDKDNRHFITDLRPDEIEVQENGVPQKVMRFASFTSETEEVPINVAYAVDTSGSMYADIDGLMKIDMAKETGQMLIQELGPMDKMSVVTFDETPKLSPLISDKNTLKDEIDKLRVHFGYTAFFDALLSTMDDLNNESGRKLLIICSDGVDNLSRHKIVDVIQKLNESTELTAIILGTITPEAHVSFTKGVKPETGKQVLQQLADDSAGFAFFPKTLKEVDQVRDLIRNFVKSQYSLVYSPTNQKVDGTFRTVNIQCKRKGVVLHYRKGYFAK